MILTRDAWFRRWTGVFLNFRLIASYRNQGNKFLSHANEVLMEEKPGALFVLPPHTSPHTKKGNRKRRKTEEKGNATLSVLLLKLTWTAANNFCDLP